MIGLLKDLTREIQNKPWVRFAKKDQGSSETAPVSEMEPKKAESFCDPESKEPCITVCHPKAGCECNCDAVRQALNDEIASSNLNVTVGDLKVGCAGKCKTGPLVGFPQKGFFYRNVSPDIVPTIVHETLARGRLLYPYLSISPDRSYRNDIMYDKESGMLAAIHDKVCMVEAAKYFMDFEEGLSCGKCVPCRIGLKRMHESMQRIVSGAGTAEDIEHIKSLCQTMIDTPHCEFAMTSSRPVLSAMKHFADEFQAHIERQECPAGVCKELVEIQRKRAVRARLSGKKKK